MKIKAPISPGEFFDKLTILVNKVYHCKDDHDVKWAMIGLIELAGSYPGMSAGDWNKIADGLLGIRDANKELWHLEELVRKDPGERVHDRLKVSDVIREKNFDRYEAKQWVDEQLDATREIKDYATDRDS